MIVQCEFCGKEQDFDPEYKICLFCANPLEKSNALILKQPRRGKGMQGVSILTLLASILVFAFVSKYLGFHLMAISVLLYIWGFYRSYRYRLDAQAQHVGKGKL